MAARPELRPRRHRAPAGRRGSAGWGRSLCRSPASRPRRTPSRTAPPPASPTPAPPAGRWARTPTRWSCTAPTCRGRTTRTERAARSSAPQGRALVAAHPPAAVSSEGDGERDLHSWADGKPARRCRARLEGLAPVSTRPPAPACRVSRRSPCAAADHERVGDSPGLGRSASHGDTACEQPAEVELAESRRPAAAASREIAFPKAGQRRAGGRGRARRRRRRRGHPAGWCPLRRIAASGGGWGGDAACAPLNRTILDTDGTPCESMRKSMYVPRRRDVRGDAGAVAVSAPAARLEGQRDKALLHVHRVRGRGHADQRDLRIDPAFGVEI